eukprot:TRINITY_DN1780_c1_g1_i5.p1 TRINITY_DN1780_c1_g1~~TRINITY_DN1780_c1_g1_i5.p1  ORF type:complete len:233 (+),score=45.60 TRINITY_DN1780_c1_g1_i5:1071-1769(+)
MVFWNVHPHALTAMPHNGGDGPSDAVNPPMCMLPPRQHSYPVSTWSGSGSSGVAFRPGTATPPQLHPQTLQQQGIYQPAEETRTAPGQAARGTFESLREEEHAMRCKTAVLETDMAHQAEQLRSLADAAAAQQRTYHLARAIALLRQNAMARTLAEKRTEAEQRLQQMQSALNVDVDQARKESEGLAADLHQVEHEREVLRLRLEQMRRERDELGRASSEEGLAAAAIPAAA